MKDVKEQKLKTYSLSKDELANIGGRLQTRDYLMEVIEMDVNNYINAVVKRRLNISPDVLLSVDLEKGIVEEKPKEPVIQPIKKKE